MEKYALRLNPAFKDNLWGGTRLKSTYPDCTCTPLAEAWVLSCHEAGPSTVINGELSGLTLPEALEKLGDEALGENGRKFDFFPVLIKLIDAKQDLSVQVHPDDEYALKNEGGYGKTEMWYIVDCEPGAQLYYGFKNEITKEEFEKHIKDNTLTEVLHAAPVKKGETYFIPSGTIHAIGKGILIAEIQQNSNTTYRVYDYGRVGADGKLRELHIDKAIDVTRLAPAENRKPEGDGILADCEYFTTRLIKGSAELDVDDKSFSALLVLSGNGSLVAGDETLELKTGDSIFIPAGMGSCCITGDCEIIETRV